MCERLTNTECSKSTIRRIPVIENDINQFEIDRYIFIHLLYNYYHVCYKPALSTAKLSNDQSVRYNDKFESCLVNF